MRVSTTLKAAGVALALGSLAFLIPPQAGAAGSGGGGDAACITGCQDSAAIDVYLSQGYTYGIKDAPVRNADLFHVKLRGHDHSLEFKSFNAKGKVVNDEVEWRKNSENAWFNPAVVSTVSITLAGHSTVTDADNGYHCYFEDKNGNLQRATGSCNSK